VQPCDRRLADGLGERAPGHLEVEPSVGTVDLINGQGVMCRRSIPEGVTT
jgi:hypothetical protein